MKNRFLIISNWILWIVSQFVYVLWINIWEEIIHCKLFVERLILHVEVYPARC